MPPGELEPQVRAPKLIHVYYFISFFQPLFPVGWTHVGSRKKSSAEISGNQRTENGVERAFCELELEPGGERGCARLFVFSFSLSFLLPPFRHHANGLAWPPPPNLLSPETTINGFQVSFQILRI